MKLNPFYQVFFLWTVAIRLVSEGKVLTLNDGNFEHLTQATTGATTGHHFVKFYAPWCGHCKKLEPVWKSLDEKLAQHNDLGVVLGDFDATKTKELPKLFGVRGYPTLVMFSQGKMIKYTGNRDLTSLLKFCMGGFQDESKYPPQPVPKPKDIVWQQFEMLYKDLEELWKLRKAALGVVFSLGLIIGIFIGASCCAPSGRKIKIS